MKRTARSKVLGTAGISTVLPLSIALTTVPILATSCTLDSELSTEDENASWRNGSSTWRVSRGATPHTWDAFFEVELGPDRPMTMHARMFYNPIANPDGAVMVGIPGGTRTSFNYRRLTQSMFSSSELKHEVRLFIALDKPGHGDSGLPPGEQLGDMTMEDNTAAVLASLEQISELGITIDAMIGHSMGGLVVQMVQRDLLAQGTSLRDEYGVESAILVASALPAAIPHPNGAAQEAGFEAFTDPETNVFYLPEVLWAGFHYTNVEGDLVDGAPTVEEIVTERYNSGESDTAIDQLLIAQPSVPAGIFADSNGTEVAVIGFEYDFLLPPHVMRALYTHSTGEDPDALDSSYTPVVGVDALHDMLTFRPEAAFPGMCKVMSCNE